MRRTWILPLLLIGFVVTNIAFAIGYFYLTGTAHLKSVTPYVMFYQWSDGAKTKTMELNMSITSDDWTIVDNATQGIINTKNGLQICAFYVESISIGTNRPANLTIQIVNATKTKAKWTTTDWTNLGTDFAVPFNMYANEKATLKLWILGSHNATDCDIVFKIRTPNEGT